MKFITNIKKWNRREEGSIAIFVAISMIILMASTALAVDLGMATYKTSKLQNAMDSAALAAAQELPAANTSSPEWVSASAIATKYAQANGVDTVTITPVMKNGKIMGVNTTAGTEVEFTVAKVLGKENGIYSRAATAEKQPVSGMSGIVPLAAWNTLMTTGGGINPGDSITLKVGVDGQKEYPGSGWFGALDFESSGAHDYKYYLTHGYDGDISVGDILNTENGNMQGPTKQGYEDRIAGHTACTFANHEPDCPRVIIAPIVDAFDTSGHFKVKVVGFAAFFIETATKDGNQEVITGKYIGPYEASGDSSTDSSAEDYGVYAVKLSE